MENDTPQLGNDEFFILYSLLIQAKDAVSKARHMDLERFNINKERRAVLWSVKNNGGESTPVKVARQLLKEINTVSEMLNRMEKQGLVVKTKRPGKSSAIVKLTEKGEETFYQSRYNEVDKRVFSVLPKKRRERLAADLWKIRNQALRELGIPEWHIEFPPDPSNLSQHKTQTNKRKGKKS